MPYVNCQFNVDFVPNPNLPPGVQYTYGGNPSFQTSYVGNRCDGFGAFTIQLPDNNVISPAAPYISQWRFQFQSAGGYVGGPFGCMVTVTITGATQDVSAAIQPVCPPLPGGGGGSGVNPGTPYQVTRYDPTGTNIQDSTGSDNPANGPTQWASGLSVENNAGYRKFVNSPNGTTTNLTVCYDPTSPAGLFEVTTCPAGTTNALGIADNGAGTTGNVKVAMFGFHPGIYDGVTTTDDWFGPSATIAGYLTDLGPTKPTNTEVMGHVVSVNTGSGTLATSDLFTGDTIAPGGGSGVTTQTCAQVGGIAAFISTILLGCDTNATTDFAGHFLMKSLGLTDTTLSGFLFQTKGPALPTLAAANSFYMAAGTSFGTTWGMEPANSIPTNGDCAKWATGDATGWMFLADAGAGCGSPIRGISFTIYTGSALTSGTTIASTDYVTVPFACTINAYNLAIDTGTITVKFWKVATGTAIPTSGNSINTSGVSIASGTAIHSTTLSDFTTTTITANDIMAMNITAVAGGANYVNGVISCQ